MVINGDIMVINDIDWWFTIDTLILIDTLTLFIPSMGWDGLLLLLNVFKTSQARSSVNLLQNSGTGAMRYASHWPILKNDNFSILTWSLH